MHLLINYIWQRVKVRCQFLLHIIVFFIFYFPEVYGGLIPFNPLSWKMSMYVSTKVAV